MIKLQLGVAAFVNLMLVFVECIAHLKKKLSKQNKKGVLKDKWADICVCGVSIHNVWKATTCCRKEKDGLQVVSSFPLSFVCPVFNI